MSNYYKKNQQPGFIETILTTIGKGLWFLVSWPFRKWHIANRISRIDKTANLAKWREIEKLLESGDEIHAKHAVVEADNFFDRILKLKGSKGTKFAERLKNLEDHFSRDNYQLIWQAHKLRNQISHEHDFHPTAEDCRQALQKFRRGIENLGAL